MNTLIDFRHKRKYVAENGEQGGKRNCSGKSGKDTIVKVCGRYINKDAKTKLIIADMSGKIGR